MKRNKIGRWDGILVMLFFGVIAMAGMTLGLMAGAYFSSLLAGIPLSMDTPIHKKIGLWALPMLVGVVLGGFGVGEPLFVLGVKPFYTKQAIIDFVNAHPPAGYDKTLVELANKIGWFWLDLLYPADK